MSISSLSSSQDRGGADERETQRPTNAKISSITTDLLLEIGEDPSREGLVHTPERVARAWEYLASGYDVDLNKLVNGAIFEEKYDEIVSVKRIRFFSLCEHHLLPFYGTCSVAYIPDGKVIGLSKIPRIVNMYARRLQLQERLTQQIAEAIQNVLQPKGVAVVMEAYHMCMMMRGVEEVESRTQTSEMVGAFKNNPQTRQEFLSLIGMDLLR